MATEQTIKAGIQSAKGTALTTGLLCGRFTDIGAGLTAEYSGEDVSEYACAGGATVRPTQRKSSRRLTGYTAGLGPLSAFLYPDLIGVWLLMSGYQVSTSADTPVSGAHTHTFTLGTESAQKWGTVLREIGTGGTFEQRSTDTKVTEISISSAQSEVTYSVSGIGITYDDAVGTETHTAESEEKLLQKVSSGDGIAVTINGTLYVETTPQTRPYLTHNITHAMPLEPEAANYAITKADFENQGIDLSGSMDIEVDKTIHDEVWYNGGSAVSEDVATGSVVQKWESAGYITGTTPYSLTMNASSCEFPIPENISATAGSGKIRVELGWWLVDNVTTPITWTLINGVSAYV